MPSPKLLTMKHDGGHWAWEVQGDDDIRSVLSYGMFDRPINALSAAERKDLEKDFRTLAEDWELVGEQWSVELQDGGFGDAHWTQSREDSAK